MPKMLINLVIIESRGVSRAWLLKWKKLQDLGCQIYFNCGLFIKEVEIKDIYNFNENFSEIKELGPGNYSKISYIFYALKRNFIALTKIKDILKGEYELIYSPAMSLDLVFLPWLVKFKISKIKWVVVFDNVVPLRDPGNKAIRFLTWTFFQISLLLLKKADVIFVISKELKKYLVSRGFDKNKIVLTGNAIEGDLVRKAKNQKKYSTDGLFIGRINETKGIYDMLKAVDMVRKKYPYFCLGIMGRGDKRTEKEFKQKIEKAGLSRNIKFFGYRVGQEKFDIIKSSKVFLFLSKSKSESFGMALLEAVCCGLPAIAYDLEPYREMYLNNEIFVFSKGDWKQVAEKAMEMFDKENFDNPQGEMLLEKYGSWDRIAGLEFKALKR